MLSLDPFATMVAGVVAASRGVAPAPARRAPAKPARLRLDIPAVDLASFASPIDALLSLIDQYGPVDTPALCRATGLHGRQVWGLLKPYRARGQVLTAEGKWTFNLAAGTPSELQRMAKVLRAAGWTVTPPEGA